MNRYPKGTPQGDIGERAEAILQYRAPEWVKLTKVPLERDFGIDYRAEFRTGMDLTGIECGLQLKGIKQAELDKPFIAVPIAASTVRYWNSKPYPVVLVVVDLHTERMFSRVYCGEIEPRSDAKFVTLRVAHTLSWETIRDAVATIFRDKSHLQQYRDRIVFQETTNHLFMTHIIGLQLMSALSSGTDPNDTESHAADYMQRLLVLLPVLMNHITKDLLFLTQRNSRIAAAAVQIIASYGEITNLSSAPDLGGPQIIFVNPGKLPQQLGDLVHAIDMLYFGLQSYIHNGRDGTEEDATIGLTPSDGDGA